MEANKDQFVKEFTPFAIFFLLDGVLTSIGLNEGLVREVNPALRGLGPIGLLLLKMGGLAVVALVGWNLWRSSPGAATLALRGLGVVMFLVTLWVGLVLAHELAYLKWGVKFIG